MTLFFFNIAINFKCGRSSKLQFFFQTLSIQQLTSSSTNRDSHIRRRSPQKLKVLISEHALSPSTTPPSPPWPAAAAAAGWGRILAGQGGPGGKCCFKSPLNFIIHIAAVNFNLLKHAPLPLLLLRKYYVCCYNACSKSFQAGGR